MASEREVGVDRIIAFGDGVVAIAITLLVPHSLKSIGRRAQPLPT